MDAIENLSAVKVVKLAGRIRDRVLLRQPRRAREVRRQVEALTVSLNEFLDVRRRLGLALDRELPAATAKVLEQAQGALYGASTAVTALERALDSTEARVPTVRDVADDLLAAQEEFDLKYYPQEAIVAAVTEEIELRGVVLGPFEIQVHINNLGQARASDCLRVVAVSPHPAAGSSSTTHPHVRDDHLCAGDAGAALEAALVEGRLLDVFQLVNSVLTTYNEHSPFVSLDNWNGTSCHECGYVTNDDELHFCDSCENDVCGECYTYCARCDCSMCVNCQERCPVCNATVCSGCITQCPECEERLCTKCQEENKCPCLEEEEKEEIEDESNTNEVPVAGAGAAGTQPTDEGEEFCIVHVNDVTEST